jgi:hypothetical protein
MAIYTFQIKETGEYGEIEMHWSELDQFVIDNPELQYYPGAPMIVAGREGGLKVDTGFKDLIKEMKKFHKKGNFGAYTQ